jgi:anaerobic magnesium-protoporphyrin IX monomethyl ester cyclase
MTAQTHASRDSFHVQFVAMGDIESGWLGLGFLSAALKRIDGVSVAAAYYAASDMDRACEEIAALKPDLVGLPVLQANLKLVREFVRRTRARLPSTHFTLGNREVSAQPELMMTWCPEIDSAVFGEGEQTLAEIVLRLKERRPSEDCAGACFRVDGKIRKNPARSVVRDLERLGNPDRAVLPTEYNILLGQKVHSVMTARGCTAFCTFCEMGRVKPGEMRVRSIAHVLDEVEALMREDGATYILFSDDSFEDGDPVPGKRFDSLCEAIRERDLNFRFFLMCKANAITEESRRTLRDLKTTGLDMMFIGIESGNDADLKLYGKSARKQDNVQALEILADLGISVHPGFIMFNPYSTFVRLRENVEFLRTFGLLCSTSLVATRFRLYSGVPLTRKVFRDGLVEDGVDFPIAEGHGYRFQEPRVGLAWAGVQALGTMPTTIDAILNTHALTRWLTDTESPFRGDRLAEAFVSMFDEFWWRSNEAVASLVTRVFDMAEAGETDIAAKIAGDRARTAESLGRSWTTVNKGGMLVRSLLSRQGLFPIRNHGPRDASRRELLETGADAMPDRVFRAWTQSRSESASAASGPR